MRALTSSRPPRLFSAGRSVESTIRVARYVDAPEAECRRWAHANGVQRVGRGFAWSYDDVVRFLETRVADLEELRDEAEDDD